jgi:hypothetical protein
MCFTKCRNGYDAMEYVIHGCVVVIDAPSVVVAVRWYGTRYCIFRMAVINFETAPLERKDRKRGERLRPVWLSRCGREECVKKRQEAGRAARQRRATAFALPSILLNVNRVLRVLILVCAVRLRLDSTPAPTSIPVTTPIAPGGAEAGS